MIPGIGERPVADTEWLARYILRHEYVRSDGSLRPDPFIPYKQVELSVTRHLGLDEREIWEAGQSVAAATATALHGRADVQAHVFARQRLQVLPKPLGGNLNHADVVGWPADKPAQKEIALLIARAARFTAKPQA